MRREQLYRQIQHWRTAAERLAILDNLAAPAAWQQLELYLGVSIRTALSEAANQLKMRGELLVLEIERSNQAPDLDYLQQRLLEYRNQYLQTETTLHFFTDAINTRTNPGIAAILRGCDVICQKSLTRVLAPFGIVTPPILTYLDKGLGASILKHGLRLWDHRTVSPAAAIKVTYHNLSRPTAIQHEAGHQLAHLLDWNTELRQTLYDGLRQDDDIIATAWSNWASEIAADAFAFVNAGYAAVAALHDVLAGSPHFVMAYNPNDPHPISYLRVLMNIEMCRTYFGAGAWDDLETYWRKTYQVNEYAFHDAQIIQQSERLLPKIVPLILSTPQRAFRGKRLIDLVNPMEVQPQALLKFAAAHSDFDRQQPTFVRQECLRLLALNGLRLATQPAHFKENTGHQEQFMLRLGANSL
jgi:hypothetical protein